MFANKKLEKNKLYSKGISGINDHISIHLGRIPILLLAIINYQYLNIDSCKFLKFDWISKIIIRDLFISFFFGCVWDFLEIKLLKHNLITVKYNK